MNPNSSEINRITKESIAIAAESLLRDNQPLTVVNICSRAGVSRNAYYRNFKTIDDILIFSMRWKWSAYVDKNKIDGVGRDHLGPYLIRFFYEQQDFIRVLNKHDQIQLIEKLFLPLYEENEAYRYYFYSTSYLIYGFIRAMVDNDFQDTPDDIEKTLLSFMTRRLDKDKIDVNSLYNMITRLLINKQLTITTMESMTSGYIASLITDTEGSSAVMKGAFVTYSNEVKVLQGVPEEIIDSYGVYSKETAIAMAKACKQAYGANIGLGVTGTTGNVDPNNKDSIPGEVYFAIVFKDEVITDRFEMPALENRKAYKRYAAAYIGTKLLEKLEK